MDLSIIVVSWNAKDFLFECLRSLRHETADHIAEIIVVENASSDNSADLVREQFPDVRLICNDVNLGFAKANNIGINQSIGRYIFFINSDVTVQKGCIDRLLAYMDQHPEIGILGPKILAADGRNVQRSCMGFPTLWNTFCRAIALDNLFPKSRLLGGQLMTYWPHNTIRSVDVINGCFWVVRREALNQVGLLDDNFFIYGEDIDWCKRFKDAGWEIVFFPGAEAIHYGGISSSNEPIRFYIEKQHANLQYWEKHHSRPAQIGFLLITWLHQIIRILGQTVLYMVKPSNKSQVLLKIRRSLTCVRWLSSTSSKSKNLVIHIGH